MQAVTAAEYRRGVLLVTAATVVWSSAGLLARLVDTDPWTTLFWRSAYAGLCLFAYLLWRDGRGIGAAFARLGAAGLAMAVCFAASMICFINALALTTVATALIYQAASPLFAAAMARVFLGERVSRGKLVAILVSFAGVLVIVAGVHDDASLWGNIVAAICGLSYAATIVLARARPDVPTTEASVVAIVIVMAVSAPMAVYAMPASAMAVLGVFGVFQMGVALIMFMAGVRLIPSADAGLISVLESALAPLLVWLTFGENPGLNTLIGGAIVILAVIAAARTDRVA